ncbi:MAG: hypothetical protein NTX03_10925 [Bacteroidetes bacterium]|nr:hypothetical protein [Bacteroidota bacterium]
MNQDFIPAREAAFRTWLSEFKTNIGTLGVQLGMLPNEVTDTQADCDEMIAAIDFASAQKTAAKNANTTKKQKKVTKTEILRTLAARLKTSPNYTAQHGTTLKIIGVASNVDINTLTIDFTLTAIGNGRVEIEFNKPGGIDGVNVYSRLKGGNGNWTLVALDNYSPYVDTRPITSPTAPEIREYALRPVMHDAEVGLLSGIKEIVVL